MAGKFKGHYQVIGHGVPVVCIAGFGSSLWVFEWLAERLRGRYCFVLLDNRGMGRSPKAMLPYGLRDLAGDVLDLMDDLGFERFGVIGLSMGGFVAQCLATQVPERIGALVLLCTSSSGPEFKPLFPGMREEQVRAIYALEARARLEAALSPAVCPLLSTRYPEVYQYVVDRRSREQEDPAQVMLQFFAVTAFMEQALPLERIEAPTLILAGEQDALVPLANAQLLQARIPGAMLTVFAETDHLFFLEQADAVAERIRAFLG